MHGITYIEESELSQYSASLLHANEEDALPSAVFVRIAQVVVDDDSETVGWWLLKKDPMKGGIFFDYKNLEGVRYDVLLPGAHYWFYVHEFGGSIDPARSLSAEPLKDIWVLNIVELADEAIEVLVPAGKGHCQAVHVCRYRVNDDLGPEQGEKTDAVV